MAASGPLGVVLAVFALGARSVVDRRRVALTLAAARGGSPLQVRGAMALEGLVLGVIPGAVGIAVAAAVVPAPVGLAAVLPAVLLTLAPAVLFAASAQAGGIRATRSDLDPRVVGRARRIAEIIVVLLAAVALFLLVRRGLVTSVDATGVDPLLAATPLLLSLAVCVGVLRLYPYPLLTIHKRLQGSRKLVGFIGSGRAVRDPSVGLAAALAIVVAVSVAVFSATLLTTLDDALQTTASAEVGGGDLSVSARYLLDDQVAAIAAVPGVDVSAGIDDQGTAALRAGSAGTNAELLTGETTGLSRIRSDIPDELDTELDGAIPIVVSQDLADEFDTDSDLELQGEPVRVVAVLPNDSGLGQNATWVLVDTAFIDRLGDFAFAPQLVIIRATADAAPAEIATAISEAVTIARVTTFDEALAETQDSPTVAGLRLAFMLAILAVSLLAVIAVVLSSVIGTPARNRLLGSLRTLGLSTRQAGGLAAWELAPVVITALLAGTLLGIALPLVVTATVDLSAFTGGLAVTVPHYNPLFLAAVLGIVAVATILAAAISVALSLRRTPASTVKIGAD
jgi:putative ABC transport system permease protein